MTSNTKEILFHEYALSPFSEKIRRIFAYKKIPYRSVDQPMWMPKPHLTPLTDGYRRIPVLQVGADVYCDTALMVRKLDLWHPDSPLVPAGSEAVVHAIEQWADKQLFLACVPVVFASLATLLPGELLEDRKKMRPDLDIKALEASVPHCLTVISVAAARLEASFAKQAFILGDRFTAADAALYHCLWFLRNAEPGAKLLARYPALVAWMQRIEGFGAPAGIPLPPDEALAIAKANEPGDRLPGGGDSAGQTTYKTGDRVAICSDDLPSDVFRGTVVALSGDEIVIERQSETLGRLWQHFPRTGYLVSAA